MSNISFKLSNHLFRISNSRPPKVDYYSQYNPRFSRADIIVDLIVDFQKPFFKPNIYYSNPSNIFRKSPNFLSKFSNFSNQEPGNKFDIPRGPFNLDDSDVTSPNLLIQPVSKSNPGIAFLGAFQNLP
jgi:hypothetical protein